MKKNRKEYVPAITPRLRKLLIVVLTITAILGANSAYLAAVTALESFTGETYQNYFYQYMFLAHLLLGLLLIVPLLVFAGFHIRNAWRRKNRRAVKMGYALFAAWLLLMGTGILLTRIGPLEIREQATRQVVYWLHVTLPFVAIWLYWLHRLAGPPIKWRVGLGYGALVGIFAAVALAMHQSDPRTWQQVGSVEGVKYFEPSLARTSTGKFIPLRALNNDKYCADCHADVHAGWATSAHRFSSFNNAAYLASIRETRKFSLEREGSVRRARWCAGCHDPAPFFSGEFDNPDYDDVNHPSAHVGISCTTCHAITHVNSPRGNADYTIEEPLHYPFAYSTNPTLQWLNRQLVKAKPAFHKKTFLKPLHKSAEFCATCHKVHLPKELNDYKFLRGQNHYDSFLLSGVSGHGARSFYYPEKAHQDCNACHMPLEESDDFGAKHNPGLAGLSVHDHTFVGANTALPFWRDEEATIKKHQEFLRKSLRVDIFGVREGARIDGSLTAPLRPELPVLEPGEEYLLETVIRTLTLGHHFTQGTSDSNEIWLEVKVTSGDRLVGRSGLRDEKGEVDRWSHFVNSFVLDREGNRIARRNAQDIFVPLYSHQIPPGAGQTVHYRLKVPDDVEENLHIDVRLLYRKFDREYVEFVAGALQPSNPLRALLYREGVLANLPTTTLCSDQITLPVAKSKDEVNQQESAIPTWQRWNDYGIGLLLKDAGELRQAEEAFAQVEKLGRYDGPLNLARVQLREGRLDDAVSSIERAASHQEPAAPPWTLSWISGEVNRQQGHLEAAEENFRAVLSPPTAEMRARNFDFRKDYFVRNLLGETLFDRARRQRGESNAEKKQELLKDAADQFQQTLELDPENPDAHYNLQLIYGMLDDQERATFHQQLHQKYKVDDNARDRAIAAARTKYPAANHAAEAVVIYDLHRSEE